MGLCARHSPLRSGFHIPLKKRVLIFSLAYFPHVGGAEVAVREITKRLADINFTLITLRIAGEPRQETEGNLIIHRVGYSGSYLQKILFIPLATFHAIRLHSKQRFGAFWAMMTYMLFPIVLLRLAGVRVPYLLTLQEGDPWQHMFGRWFILPFRPLLSVGFKNASAVQAISNYLAEWAVRMGHRKEPEVIPNGVETERFGGPPITHQGAVLITTSRLVHKNGIDDVIRALPHLPGVRFRILGTGPDDDSLRELAKSLGVEAQVEFFGHVDHGDLPRHLHAADIFIRPSRSEGMGNSFIEAMAAGLPIIGTLEGGIADFLVNSETGWVVAKDRPDQIALAVQDIMARPEKVQQVTEHAQKLVIGKYDWNLIAQKMQMLFERIVDKPDLSKSA